MRVLRLSHSGALRTQWVGSRGLQKLRIIIIIIIMNPAEMYTQGQDFLFQIGEQKIMASHLLFVSCLVIEIPIWKMFMSQTLECEYWVMLEHI